MPDTRPNSDDFSGICHIIWDLDGTLYRFDEDFLVACNTAAARAAVDLGVPLELEAAIDFAWKSHEATGQSILHFLTHYGVAAQEMHDCYHSYIDEKLIKVTQKTADMLAQTTAAHGLEHVIITHASREWAGRVLGHLGLDGIFPDERILAKEDYDFQSKCSSFVPFGMGLDILKSPAENTLVIEDTVKNLKAAKENGLRTILFHHGQLPDPMPDYVDTAYTNILEFLENFRA